MSPIKANALLALRIDTGHLKLSEENFLKNIKDFRGSKPRAYKNIFVLFKALYEYYIEHLNDTARGNYIIDYDEKNSKLIAKGITKNALIKIIEASDENLIEESIRKRLNDKGELIREIFRFLDLKKESRRIFAEIFDGPDVDRSTNSYNFAFKILLLRFILVLYWMTITSGTKITFVGELKK